MTTYIPGFGTHVVTEAVAGALPVGQNSPQRPPFGLYAEQLSGTAFTAPRHENRRSWLYRMRPTATHAPFTLLRELDMGTSGVTPPNRYRWSARPMADAGAGTEAGGGDFIDTLLPVMANGAPESLSGVALFTFAATRDMGDRVMFDADGELLILPQDGRLSIMTELGRIDIEPQMLAVIPRGIRFRIDLPDGRARGYVTENRGAMFRLPDLGPIGSNGLANPRDFETPVAAFEDRDDAHEVVQKWGDRLWASRIDRCPFDVVAWHGNLAPYRYDMRRFNTMGTVSFDHPDPSIFTVLTSPSGMPGTANADFVVFPPRWMVAEGTFRPPWFHRNVMSEAMGLIAGVYDAKEGGGFGPGAISLHNLMGAHGPDVAAWRAASEAELKPVKIDGTLAFMVESCWPYRVCDAALASAQPDYDDVWAGFPKARVPGR